MGQSVSAQAGDARSVTLYRSVSTQICVVTIAANLEGHYSQYQRYPTNSLGRREQNKIKIEYVLIIPYPSTSSGLYD